MSSDRQTILFHLGIWTFIFTIMLTFVPLFGEIPDAVALMANTILFGGLMVYPTLAFSVPRLLDGNSRVFVFNTVILLVVLTITRFYTQEIFGIEHLLEEYPVRKGFLLCIQLIVLTAVFTAYSILRRWSLERRNEARLQKEKIEEELKFLKSQINPHFLFNTLNNIYSLAFRKSDETAPMVAKLAKIMRYMLYDCNQERVPLHKEVDLLKEYVELHQLRKGNEGQVDFFVEGIGDSSIIAPMILINFVENSFKHSDVSSNPEGWVQISMTNEDDTFLFTVANSLEKSQVEKKGGMGLKNSRRLLELNYPGKYDLRINRSDNEYSVNLSVQLK